MVAEAKKSFLVVYDYGMGGVWSIMHARSTEEITAKYPQLRAFDHRPEWMNDEQYAHIAAGETLDVDAEPSGWLLAMLREGG